MVYGRCTYGVRTCLSDSLPKSQHAPTGSGSGIPAVSEKEIQRFIRDAEPELLGMAGGSEHLDAPVHAFMRSLQGVGRSLERLGREMEEIGLGIVGVTQRIVSWGRSRDGSEFARGNRSVDTEGFCNSQMTLNSGLRWLRATPRCFRWNGRNGVAGESSAPNWPLAICHPLVRPPQATLKPWSLPTSGTAFVEGN
jgi:hypothetical protein